LFLSAQKERLSDGCHQQQPRFGDDREGARGREDNVCSVASFQFSQFGKICSGLLIMNLLKLLTLRGYSLTVGEYVA
jgi:hypothetical protein